MMDETNATSSLPAPATWVVTGVQTGTADVGRSRVDVRVRGEAAGAVDRGTGVDQIRIAIWDDGQEKDFTVVDLPLRKTVSIDVRLGFDGRYLTAADGIGLTITLGAEAGGECVFDLDPFFPDQG